MTNKEVCGCEQGHCVEWKIETREHAVCQRCGYTQAETRAIRQEQEIAELKEKMKSDDALKAELKQAQELLEAQRMIADERTEQLAQQKRETQAERNTREHVELDLQRAQDRMKELEALLKEAREAFERTEMTMNAASVDLMRFDHRSTVKTVMKNLLRARVKNKQVSDSINTHLGGEEKEKS